MTLKIKEINIARSRVKDRRHACSSHTGQLGTGWDILRDLAPSYSENTITIQLMGCLLINV